MTKNKSHIYSCGLLIVTTFLGERIELFSIPLYCYIIILTLVLLLKNKGVKRIRGIPVDLNNLSHYSIMWIIASTMMSVFSIGKVGTLPYLYCIASALILYVVYKVAEDYSSLELLYKAAYVGCLFTCIACTVELITGVHYIPTNDYYLRMGHNNTFGFQVNVNDNATLLASCLFIPFFFSKKKMLNAAVVCWIFFLLIKIDSRMVLLSAIASGFVAIIVLLSERFTRKSIKHFSIILSLVCVSLILLLPALLNENIFLQVVSDELNYQNDLARLMFMRKAIENTDLFGFLFGNGPGITQYRVGYSLHCVLLEILCDYGILVGIWLISFLVKMLFSFSKETRITSKMYTVSFATSFTLLSFCSSSMLRIRVVWVMLALVWSKYQISLGGDKINNGQKQFRGGKIHKKTDGFFRIICHWSGDNVSRLFN